MAVSKYFKHLTNANEQKLMEALTIEEIQLFGMDINYLPRTYLTDSILLEPTASNFNSSVVIEAYFHDVQGYGDSQGGDLMTKFGFQQADTLNVSIAKARWRALKVPDRLERPVEGDLIYIPMTKSVFEINHVEHETPFWTLGKYNTFNLSCSLYTRGYNEKFNSTVPAIDATANAVNTEEINAALNNAIGTATTTLLDFSEKNPFDNF